MEPARSEIVLSEEERKRSRALVVTKSIKYFEDAIKRSSSEGSLFTRRRNLSAHLGIDESVSKKEVQIVTLQCLPLPVSTRSSQKSLSRCSRYTFL